MGDVIATGIAWTIIAVAASVLIGMVLGFVIRLMGGDDVPTPKPPDVVSAADLDELERMAHIWFEL